MTIRLRIPGFRFQVLECPKKYEDSSVNSGSTLLIIRVVVPYFKSQNKVTSVKVCNRYKRLIYYSTKFYRYYAILLKIKLRVKLYCGCIL